MEINSELLYCLIALLILFFLSIAYFFVYSGLFASIEVKAQRPTFGNLRIAYKFARGSYKNAGHLFTEAHSIAPELKTLGIYYDDPQQVNTADLRYCVGVILSEGDSPYDEDLANTYKNHGFKQILLPAVDHAVWTTFPFKSILSFFIGVARVYPRLAEYIQEKKLCAHPMIEIYEKEWIIFLAPLSKQDEFYVEETQEADIASSALEDSENQASEPESVQEEDHTNNDAGSYVPPLNGAADDSEDSSGSSFEELNH